MKIAAVLIVACFASAALATPLKFKRMPRTGRIVGGVDADPGQFPWQVSFQMDFSGFGYSHVCGGSVYDANTIITAGHCCDAGAGPDEMQIVAGEHNLEADDGTEQILKVEEYRLHENYDGFDITNDICILKLAGSLELAADAVEVVSLPEALEETTGTLVVSGWGVLTETSSSLPDILQFAEIPIVSDEDCLAAYDDFFVKPVESMICAGEEDKDHCFGDSGGPLVETGTNKLIGIVSWADGCARPGRPGVNTQVSYFIDWIAENSS